MQPKRFKKITVWHSPVVLVLYGVAANYAMQGSKKVLCMWTQPASYAYIRTTSFCINSSHIEHSLHRAVIMKTWFQRLRRIPFLFLLQDGVERIGMVVEYVGRNYRHDVAKHCFQGWLRASSKERIGSEYSLANGIKAICQSCKLDSLDTLFQGHCERDEASCKKTWSIPARTLSPQAVAIEHSYVASLFPFV